MSAIHSPPPSSQQKNIVDYEKTGIEEWVFEGDDEERESVCQASVVVVGVSFWGYIC